MHLRQADVARSDGSAIPDVQPIVADGKHTHI